MATEKTTGKIDLTPKGMETAEGVKRVNDALEARNNVDYECYIKLRRVAEVLCDYHNRKFLGSIDDLLQKRADAEEDVFRAIAGRPSIAEQLAEKELRKAEQV